MIVFLKYADSEGLRWTRGVEDHSAPIPEERMGEFGRSNEPS